VQAFATSASLGKFIGHATSSEGHLTALFTEISAMRWNGAERAT